MEVKTQAFDDAWNEMTIEEVFHFLVAHIKSPVGLTIMLWGIYAIGKSAVVRQAAEHCNQDLLDQRLSGFDPTDTRGVLGCNPKTGKAMWFMNPDWPLDPKGKPMVVFLDEFNHATDMVQKSAFELALDHKVGSQPFTPGTTLIMAGNREIDNSNVTPLEKPLESRVCHVYVKFSGDVFLKWARTQGGIHPTILSYLKYKPTMIFPHVDEPPAEDRKYKGEPTPRTWHKTSDLLNGPGKYMPEHIRDKGIAGWIGPGASIDFTAWVNTCGDLIPLVDDICAGKDVFADRIDKQYCVTETLVARLRNDPVVLAKRVLEYSLAMKSSHAELGGLMFQSAMYRQEEQNEFSKYPDLQDKCYQAYAKMLT